MIRSTSWHLPRAAAALDPGRSACLDVDGREVINLCTEGYLALDAPGGDAEEQRVATVLDAARAVAALKRVDRVSLHASAAEAFGAALGALAAGATPAIVADSGLRPELGELCRTAAGRLEHYPHLDADGARRALAEAGEGQAAPVVLVTEGVFGADGTVAPLAELSAAAGECDARILLEDSFAFGLLGPHGSGSARHFGTEQAIAIHAEVADLGGALGLDRAALAACPGAGGADSIDAAAAARLAAAVARLQRDVGPQERIWALTRYLREGLNAFNLDTGDTHSPITPVLCGSAADTDRAADRLFEAGVLVHVVPEPIFAGGQAGLRATLSTAHTEDELERAIEVFAKVLA